MKNKQNRYIMIIVLIPIIVVCALMLFIKSSDNETIPDGYIAVFHGGVGEQTYQTYIYKIDNGQANRGFKYINVTSTTEFWGSPNWITEINDEGEFDWTDGAFIVAEKHGAYSYVTVPNNDEVYTIEEFQKKFIMN